MHTNKLIHTYANVFMYVYINMCTLNAYIPVGIYKCIHYKGTHMIAYINLYISIYVINDIRKVN